jgi:glycosyltransferase involved in cell wall biosynthesis
MKIAVYDEHWATSGGGEKYAASFAEALAGEHEVDLLGPGPIAPADIAEKLGVDLSEVGVRLIASRPGALTAASADYDLLLNCSYMSTEPSAARRAIYVTHFPTPFDHDLSAAKRLLRSTLGPVVRRGHGSVELGTGYHLPEQARFRTYRWTSSVASFALRLPPGKGLPVSLVVGGRPAPVEPAELEVRIDGALALRTVIPSGARRAHVTFRAESTRDGRPIAVELAVANPFVPSALGLGHDDRELGVKLFSIQIGEGPGAWIGRFAPLLALPAASLAFLDSYQHIVVNSQFTSEWVQRLWGRESEVVYPAVAPVAVAGGDKRPLILSVGRFFEPRRGHSKKQLDLVRAFRALVERGLNGWEYRLVGGCHPEDEPYLAAVRREAAGLPVSIEVDASGLRLRELYAQASIFWHATGLGENERRHPWRLEHFGIAVVEAMSAGAVPVVYASGGPREIVENGVSGFHAGTAAEFATYTRRLVGEPELRRRLGEAASRRAEAFSPETFAERARSLAREIVSRG